MLIVTTVVGDGWFDIVFPSKISVPSLKSAPKPGQLQGLLDHSAGQLQPGHHRQRPLPYAGPLRMGVQQHGAPEALLTDTGGVFLVKEAQCS